MTNFEFYKEEILKMISEGKSIALKDNKPVSCAAIDCEDCEFDGEIRCYKNMFKWLYGEHVESPVLTSIEWHLLNAMKTGFITRDINRMLHWYFGEPRKESYTWYKIIQHMLKREPSLFSYIDPRKMYAVEDMLTWEHEE